MRYVYEFIGTFFLVFTVGMTLLDPDSVGIMAPLAIGLILAALVYAGGHLSGGHYNPAISLAVYIRGRLSLKDLGIYWMVQFIAALIAGYIAIYFKGFLPVGPPLWDAPRAFLGEFLFAFALCFVVLNVTSAKGTKGNSFYGLAVGSVVIVGTYAVGSISSAAFNPAVALGLMIMNLSSWSNLWILLFASFLGAFGATLIFKASEVKT